MEVIVHISDIYQRKTINVYTEFTDFFGEFVDLLTNSHFFNNHIFILVKKWYYKLKNLKQ